MKCPFGCPGDRILHKLMEFHIVLNVSVNLHNTAWWALPRKLECTLKLLLCAHKHVVYPEGREKNNHILTHFVHLICQTQLKLSHTLMIFYPGLKKTINCPDNNSSESPSSLLSTKGIQNCQMGWGEIKCWVFSMTSFCICDGGLRTWNVSSCMYLWARQRLTNDTSCCVDHKVANVPGWTDLEMGRKLKIPPPLLLTTTTVTGSCPALHPYWFIFPSLV